jgi:hypothetical protein
VLVESQSWGRARLPRCVKKTLPQGSLFQGGVEGCHSRTLDFYRTLVDAAAEFVILCTTGDKAEGLRRMGLLRRQPRRLQIRQPCAARLLSTRLNEPEAELLWHPIQRGRQWGLLARR